MNNSTERTLIVGVGSVLRGDDGVGPRVIDEMEKEDIPDTVRLHSGDIFGLDLLKVFPGYERVIIIDAALMGEEPGCIKVFAPGSIKSADFNDKFSTHGMALSETLTLAGNLGILNEVKIVGIQPENTDFSMELSDLVRSRIPDIIRVVRNLL